MKKRFSVSLLFLVLVAGGIFLVSAQNYNGTIELDIQQGNSCCTYGSTINFGNKAISFSGYNFTGDFLSSIGTPMWSCIDMYGVETGWTMVVQMQGAMTSEAGNTIAESNVQISYGDTELIGGNCVPRVHSGVDVPLNSPVILLEKDGLNPANYGSVCAMQTNNVKMKVVVDPAQAPGNYTGTIVIDIPGFMSTCTGGMLVQGAVYDSEIEGLSYVGNFGSSGVTLSGGKFTYMIGETVSFSLGGMQIGSLVPATDRKIFLPEILGKARTDLTDQKVVEVARLLQGLDQDNNVNNGITITSSDANAITGNLSGSAVNQKLISLGKPVKTAEAVVSHLEQTLVNSFTETGNVGYPWAVKAGGAGNDQTSVSVVDSSGNVYVAGYFGGTASFGSSVLVSSGAYDVYVAKLDSNGNWLWAIRGGGIANDWVQNMAIDSSGNLYLAIGVAASTSVIGSFILPTSTNNSVIAKLDTDGNWLNAVLAMSGVNSAPYGIAVDNTGDVYLVGAYSFGTGYFGSTALVSIGGDDVYYAKFDKNLNSLWAISIGSTGADSLRANPVVDIAGNTYISAYFGQSMMYGGQTMIVSGSSDSFLTKINQNGNVVWMKWLSGANAQYIMSLAIDVDQNIYAGGYFSTNLNLDSISLTGVNVDAYVAKINSGGNWLWASSGGGTGTDQGINVAVDSKSNAYLIGQALNGNYGPYSIGNAGGQDVFMAKVNSKGDWLGAWSWGSGNAEAVKGASIDSKNNLYIAGYAAGPTKLGQYSLGNSGSYDVFVKKVPYRELY